MLRRIPVSSHVVKPCSMNAHLPQVASAKRRINLNSLPETIADVDRRAYCWFQETVAAILTFF